MPLRRLAILLLLPLVAACATAPLPPVAAPESPGQPVTVDETLAQSDIPVDPAYRIGTLANGMRYIIRPNAHPDDTALVRMEIDAGALDETETELGYAHFVEHMAFNGSTNVPEGDMVRLLEREGLAFGADTNASTGFERTQYKLDLPRNSPELLDLALMLMRETASELTFSSEAVEREKGVVLAEMRDRNTYGLRNSIDSMRFQNPKARYPQRLPIGTQDAQSNATADSLKAFWAREYVPAHTTLVVVGDFDAAMVETNIEKRFADWQAREAEPQPGAGPVEFADAGRTHIYIDPALPERLEIFRHGVWLGGLDTVARRQRELLAQIGYDIINRRLQSISRQPKAPFRGAGFGTGDVFEEGRTTRLIVDTPDRKWRRGLVAAALEYRRALAFGFTQAEVDEQLAKIRAQLENSAASSDTRTHAELANGAWSLLHDGKIPSLPATILERFEQFAPEITPDAVLAAMTRDAVRLDDPLIRFRGRYEPEGGTEAIRAAWDEAMGEKIIAETTREAGQFAYSDFGTPGPVVSDTREPLLGIRTIRFANGVMLNLKTTDLERDRVRVKISVDGGDKLKTAERPFATDLVPYLAEGGLAKHSEDELETITAGRTVANEFRAADDSLTATTRTTPRDLELQMQLYAAYLTDPGYREEGVVRYRQDINRYFAQLSASPSSALGGALGGIVSDDDPRFTLLPVEDYRKLTFDALREGIGDRLVNGAIEIGMVGDIDEEEAIAIVARTFGALPPREAAFRDYTAQPARTFTADRGRRVLRHTGPADQALLRLMWPTRDDSDPVAALTLELLERVAQIEMTETLRETLGKAYSPGASSALARHWPGYGTFALTASVDVAELPAAREGMMARLKELRADPVADDLLRRARQPMQERLQNALKNNGGWLALVDRAQTEAFRIERYLAASDRLAALTAQDLRAAAQQYLDPAQALEIIVLPEGATEPE